VPVFDLQDHCYYMILAFNPRGQDRALTSRVNVLIKLPEKFFDFGSQIGDLWCIPGAFYSAN